MSHMLWRTAPVAYGFPRQAPVLEHATSRGFQRSTERQQTGEHCWMGEIAVLSFSRRWHLQSAAHLAGHCLRRSSFRLRGLNIEAKDRTEESRKVAHPLLSIAPRRPLFASAHPSRSRHRSRFWHPFSVPTAPSLATGHLGRCGDGEIDEAGICKD